MPFTIAHGAAALPFRRLSLVPSALIVGSFAPDFEYFLRLSPGGGFGHTPLGALVLTLPLSLLALWVFHAVVKRPVSKLLPVGVQRRLGNHIDEFRFGGPARFLLIIASLSIGIATHLIWDSFTHSNTWLYYRWSFLRQRVWFPLLGHMPCCKALQYGSSIVGILVLTLWFVHWYRTTNPTTQALHKSPTPALKVAIVAIMIAIASVGAIARVLAETGMPTGHTFKRLAGQAIVTAMALAWWQLVAYGIFSPSVERLTTPRPL